MANDLARADPKPTSLAIAEGWTREQVNVIKQTCASNATDTELAMFLHVAKVAGLDPLQKQIHFTKRRFNAGTRDEPKWEERVTIMAGVDGLQARAERNPDFLGTSQAVVCAKDDIQVEMDSATDEVTRIRHKFNPFGERGPVVGAWASVKRKGKVPAIAIVYFAEYNDERSPMWRNKPRVMIEKCARSTALRRAYPEAFGGIYDPAELGAEGEEPVAPVAPAPRTSAPAAIDVPSTPVDTEPSPFTEPAEQFGGPPEIPYDPVADYSAKIAATASRTELEALLPALRALDTQARAALLPVYTARRDYFAAAGAPTNAA